MTHNGHSGDAAHDHVAWPVKLLILGGIVLAIMQGSFVVSSSHDMHVWPSTDSGKVELPAWNPPQ